MSRILCIPFSQKKQEENTDKTDKQENDKEK